MYRLRQLLVNDKICEQVSMTMLQDMYPEAVIERCVQQSVPWKNKDRRVRKSTAVSLVLFVMAMGLWSRLNQASVWEKLEGKLRALHPGTPEDPMSDSGISGRRTTLGSDGLHALMRERCQLLATPETVPHAFFGRYRLMAIDGSVFRVADTPANEAAFGRGKNQYGSVSYPQVRAVLACEVGTHAVIGLEIDRCDVSEVHGAHRLLEHIGPTMLLMVDAGLISGGLIERVQEKRAHLLAALEEGRWASLPGQRRLMDGSILVWLPPTRNKRTYYPQQRGRWVRIISYRITDARLGEEGKVYRLVTTLLNPRVAPAAELIALYHERWEIELVLDEIKTHERAFCKTLRSKTPTLVRQELLGLFLVHYAIRALMAQSAMEEHLDPDRLSFTAGLFQVTEMMDLAHTLEPEEALPRLKHHLLRLLRRDLLPERRLRINRREIKQIYNKYKPKKRGVPPPAPFDPDDQFLDFVELLDPLACSMQELK